MRVMRCALPCSGICGPRAGGAACPRSPPRGAQRPPRRGQARRSRARPGRQPRGRGPGAARGAAPGAEHERLRKGEQLAVFNVVAVNHRRGDEIASNSSSKGRRPEPRKGREAEGRPLRGEDVGSRPPSRSVLLLVVPSAPALARRGGVRGARSTATKERAPQLHARQYAEAVPAPSAAAAEGRRDAWRDVRPRRRRARGPQGAGASSRATAARCSRASADTTGRRSGRRSRELRQR